MHFEPVEQWGRVPHGVTFNGDATSVGVNSRDAVYVFNRGPVPVIEFDADGNYQRGWGADIFTRPHSLNFDADDNVYFVDEGGHKIVKCSPDGDVLMIIEPQADAGRYVGVPFQRPTDISIHPTTGELFISDGYANTRVHRFSPDGEHLASWGEPGGESGQFLIPHGVCALEDGRVLVCDPENFRIQVFDVDGEFQDQWHLHKPMHVRQRNGRLYVALNSPSLYGKALPNLGHRIVVLELDGTPVTHFGAHEPGTGPGQFVAPHSLSIDSTGAVYVAEVSRSFTMGVWREDPPLGEIRSLSKWQVTG